MASRLNLFLVPVLAFCFLSGCYTQPVRHLASDIALLQVGKTSREDVLVFLGEPDEQQDMGDGTQRWLYKEKNSSFYQKTPLVGSKLGSPEIYKVAVTLRNGVVVARDYSYSDDDDLSWSKDFSWQEKKK